MTFLILTSIKIVTNLIVGLLLLLISYFFLGYNNVKAILSMAIVIARAPRWQNTTIKKYLQYYLATSLLIFRYRP